MRGPVPVAAHGEVLPGDHGLSSEEFSAVKRLTALYGNSALCSLDSAPGLRVSPETAAGGAVSKSGSIVKKARSGCSEP
ncbi:hypothetical protein Pan44_50780 [Caulifigura coniformis]|uniref:Uncharacterized protein n=1 Tax=Caulifigura coniformis TaxID=2527983 RepID=A0A517SLL2_9PLAN|nr:hypothetical protein [Caulifigura coniformis]QDT57013.1 hypothetical protein Pan44_50780 [Caulifigura coniformis]